MSAGTAVYVGWYWSLCLLILEFMSAGTALEVHLLQAGYKETFDGEPKYGNG